MTVTLCSAPRPTGPEAVAGRLAPIEAQLCTGPDGLAQWQWHRHRGGSVALRRALLLLQQGTSAEAVGKAIGVSPPTADRLQRQARERRWAASWFDVDQGTDPTGLRISPTGLRRSAMTQQSSLHVYLEWTKQRIGEMDAALASLEAKTSKMSADAKVKAEQLLAELRKRRDEFQAKSKTNAQAGEAALRAAHAQLETQWQGFEAQLKLYLDTAGKQIEQHQATFRAVADAQAKAWRETADKLHAEALKVAAAKRADIDAAIRQMKGHAAEAEVQVRKLGQAGGESWSAFSTALAQSREKLDRATREAWDAVSRAGAAKS